MKSIDNKAVKNMVEKKLNIMMGASSVEDLKIAYNAMQSALKNYYDTCLAVAEYNELVAEFAAPVVEYEPTEG